MIKVNSLILVNSDKLFIDAKAQSTRTVPRDKQIPKPYQLH